MPLGTSSDVLSLRVLRRLPGGPHAEILTALERITIELKAVSDSRIPMQLEGVMAAIRQLLAQIAREATSEESRA